MAVIFINKIQCKHCGDIIESKTTHDFKMCSCGKVGVDGGTDYLRRIGKLEDFIDRSIMELDDTPEPILDDDRSEMPWDYGKHFDD